MRFCRPCNANIKDNKLIIKDKSAHDPARYLLLGFTFLTIIPFGSNRPFFWALWGLVIAALALFFIKNRYVGQLSLQKKPIWLKAAAGLFVAYALFLILQIMPVSAQFVGGVNAPIPVILSSGTLSIAPYETWFALLRWLTNGILFILVFQLTARSRSSGLMFFGLSILAGLEALYALTALFQLGDTILFFPKESYLGVATGTFVNRNSLATFLSLGAIVSAVILTTDKSAENRFIISTAERVLCAISLAFIIAALFATNSRMGLFAGMAGLLIAVILRMQNLKQIAAILVFAIFSGMIGFYAFGFDFIDRVVRVESQSDIRLELYQNVWGMIMSRPWSGFGGGTFAQAYVLFHESSAQSSLTWDHAHSTYLALWSGAGFIFGSLPIVILLVLTGGSLTRSQVRKSFTPEAAIAIGASVTIAIHSLVDFSIEMQAVAIFYVVILAIGCSRAYQAAYEEKAS